MPGLFDTPLGLGGRASRLGGRIRLIKRTSGSIVVDPADEINISIVLSEGAALNVCREGREHRIVPKMTDHGVMVPGNRTHVTIHGDIWALQMRLPLTDLYRIAEEDHGMDPAAVAFSPVVAGHDDGLMRLMWGGLGPSEVAREVATREVAAHLLQGGLRSDVGLDRMRGGIPPARLARVLDLVEAHLDKQIPLGVMASEAALSPFHFARAFKSSVGLSPHAYLLRRRLARAAMLLSTTGLDADEIARRSGFAHTSHLGAHLRRHYGASCTQFRSKLDF